MYIYNVTTNIEESVHDNWLKWMKENHIPDVLATGKFLSAKMCRVLVEEDMGGITYSVQYTVLNKETLNAYFAEDAPKLREDALRLFPNKFVSFRTELEVISDIISESNSATNLLFTYGTLQDEQIQLSLFSRKLKDTKDALANYKLSDKKVTDSYPTIRYTGNSIDILEGKVYVLTHKELMLADSYEGIAYRRIEVVLMSGKKTWVYVENEI